MVMNKLTLSLNSNKRVITVIMKIQTSLELAKNLLKILLEAIFYIKNLCFKNKKNK